MQMNQHDPSNLLSKHLSNRQHYRRWSNAHYRLSSRNDLLVYQAGGGDATEFPLYQRRKLDTEFSTYLFNRPGNASR